MGKRKLSERAAWLYMAEAFDEAFQDDAYYFAKIQEGCATGICEFIRLLIAADRISDSTDVAMANRMRLHRPRRSRRSLYWWNSGTKAGARSRAAFCRKMATLCVEEAAAKAAKKPKPPKRRNRKAA